jgi:hypothetical protein
MKKKIIRGTMYFLMFVMLAGCGLFNRSCAQIKGTSETCYCGVSYIQFPSGVSVKYDQNGKIVTCK